MMDALMEPDGASPHSLSSDLEQGDTLHQPRSTDQLKPESQGWHPGHSDTDHNFQDGLIYDDNGSEESAYDSSEISFRRRKEAEEEEDEVQDAEEEEAEETGEAFCIDDGSVSISEIDSSEDGREVGHKRLTWPEKVETIRTRTLMDNFSRNAESKQILVLRTREELKKCQRQIKELEEKRDQIFDEIDSQMEQENITAVNRLRAEHDKICRELNLEADLEAKIKEKLTQAEYQSNLTELECSRFVKVEERLVEKERLWNEERKAEAEYRQMKEERSALASIMQERLQDRMSAMVKRDEEERRRHEAAEAARCHEHHQPFLMKNLAKVQQLEKEQKERDEVIMERRIKSVLTLKADIAANKENARVQHLRNRMIADQKKEMKQKWLEEVEAEGKDPTMVLARQRRIDKFNMEKQQFEERQRRREVEIAEKLLSEEKLLRKKKKLMPELFTDAEAEKAKFVQPLPKRELRAVKRLKKASLPPISTRHDEQTRLFEDDDSEDDLERDQETDGQLENHEALQLDTEELEATDLAQPEFEGMWDRFRPYKVPKNIEKTEGTMKKEGSSKMEQEIMAQRLQRLRDGIVVKQVAVGREFKGCAFKSKPEVIHFKDFDVGKTYQKKVILTNISHTLNVCKLSGLPEHLKDFIELKFNPPGQMSAGLTCELIVTFKPMINRDLEGEVRFLAQTGPFSIPLICTTKKCILKVDSSVVDFGTSVIGETLKRTVTLTNAGALPTSFQFYRWSERGVTETGSLNKAEEADTLVGKGEGGSTNEMEDGEVNQRGEEKKMGKKKKVPTATLR